MIGKMVAAQVLQHKPVPLVIVRKITKMVYCNVVCYIVSDFAFTNGNKTYD